MNDFRKEWLERKEESDIQLFEKIKNDPRPSITDLWELSEKRFIEWRKIHDFPKLLEHFDKTLLLFQEWKLEFNLTNQIIIDNGEITPFLEHKKLSKKNKSLFLLKQSWNGNERTIVSYGKIEGESTELGTKFHYENLLEFISYKDWLKSKKKNEEILNINSRQAPNSDSERVWIHADVYANKSDFELLKMGGIVAPVNGFGILLRGKRIEFANLCGLKFIGKINFGEEGNLSCSYCACDNWILDDFDMPLLRLEHCSVKNLQSKNSRIRQWKIYDCNIDGELINTKIYYTRIYGGAFNPILHDCLLEQTNIIDEDTSILNNNLNAYKTFKKIFHNQGDDGLAQEYYIRENEYIRQKLTGWKYVTKTLSYYYWEYGRKPHRIIYYSIAIILIFGIIFWLNSNLITSTAKDIKEFNIGHGLYFSTISFTTMGFSDLIPIGWARLLVSIEGFLGLLNMGFLIAGYTNNKY